MSNEREKRRSLNGMEKWMLDRNIEYAKAEGVATVVSRLRSQGYARIADALERRLPDTCRK